MESGGSIIFLVILVALSAFFSSTETAFLSFNKARMKSMAKQGNRKAQLVIDLEDLASRLMLLLWQRYPDAVKERYGITEEPEDTGFLGYDLLTEAGRKRGFLMARGEINTERMAKVLLDEYRSGKLGRFTLEGPEVTE